jgi:hypothetical protein
LIRRLVRFLAVVVAAVTCAGVGPGGGVARAANDPRLLWRTVETEHFRINFYSGTEDLALRMADLCESVHARLQPAVGFAPSEVTELTIVDQTESANAFASAVPFNSIRLFVVPPDDLSPLGDVDDWYGTLVTHEYTHVLHTDHIRGIPAVINAILGKTFAPNQIQPRWFLEGLAVYFESAKTSGGRLRGSAWNMYMRADVLDDNLAPLDQISSSVRRFPQGNLWYLYGSFFMRWLAETYGEEALRAVIDDYGTWPVPWGINRSIRRATGRTYEDLYPAWQETLRGEVRELAKQVRARGLREGKRITTGGQAAIVPRWVPSAAWAPHGDQIAYYRDDGHSANGLYRFSVDRDARGAVIASHEDARELVARGAGQTTFLPDGSPVFEQVEVTNTLFYFNDLLMMAPGDKSPWGLEGNRKRITEGWRASQPDASPDGRRLVFVTGSRGTTYLQIADLSVAGTLSNVHTLVPSRPYELAFAPRWSPDNRHVAYSIWKRGGFRDVRIVDTMDGSVDEIVSDRAVDGGPSYSPDGRFLYFHSDRTGISNVYAWELSTRTLHQVTNVLTGAFQPQVSPDGKTLLYLGYTSKGYDLYAMPLDRSQWLEALPYVDRRPAAPPEPVHHRWKIVGYDPLGTLRPRRYSLSLAPGNFGYTGVVSVAGNDVAGWHSISASLAIDFEQPSPQFDVSYTYGRLPLDMFARVTRAIAPGSGYAVGESYKPTYVQQSVAAEVGLAYTVLRPYDSHSMSLAYDIAGFGSNLPVTKPYDPYETPQIPKTEGLAGILRLAWAYSNAQRYLWSVGPEKGFSLSANVDVTHPSLASDYNGVRSSANFTTYFPMPWGSLSRHLAHHTVALHAGGGAAGGQLPGGTAFYVGGFVEPSLFDTIRNYIVQGGFVLRGYPTGVQGGSNYALLNAEYRFPILNLDRGPSTVPLLLNRIVGNGFVDVGGAFNDVHRANLLVGVGAELWFEMQLGYFLAFNFRLGYARGLSTGGIDKVYFVASVPY